MPNILKPKASSETNIIPPLTASISHRQDFEDIYFLFTYKIDPPKSLIHVTWSGSVIGVIAIANYI